MQFSSVAAFFEAAADSSSGAVAARASPPASGGAEAVPGEDAVPGEAAAGHAIAVEGAEGAEGAAGRSGDDEGSDEERVDRMLEHRSQKASPAKRARAPVQTPPTPASPAATPREVTPRAVKDAKRRAELEQTAQMARIRIMQSPEKLIATTEENEQLATASRLEAAQEALHISRGDKLLFVHRETGAVKELTSSPLIVVFSICIPEVAASTSSTILARPRSGKPRGQNIVLSEFVSFEVGDVTPADSEHEDAMLEEDDDVLFAMGENLSNFSDTYSARMLESIAFDASYSARHSGFKPVVFLELSDMVTISVDLPQGTPRSRVTDTKVCSSLPPTAPECSPLLLTTHDYF